MANFFVKKTDQFKVTIPFNVSDPDDPTIVFADRLENYNAVLNRIPVEHLEYHWMQFKKPDWGLDCYMRELAYVTVQPATSGGMGSAYGSPERILSQERLEEIRLRYLLVGSSFFNEASVGFVNISGRDALNDNSEASIKMLDPVILRVFLSIASQVLDSGIPIKRLLTKADFEGLRSSPSFLDKLLVEKGLAPKMAIVDETNPELKKKSETIATEPSTPVSNPETPAGTP